jgi:hypothetical protein
MEEMAFMHWVAAVILNRQSQIADSAPGWVGGRVGAVCIDT